MNNSKLTQKANEVASLIGIEIKSYSDEEKQVFLFNIVNFLNDQLKEIDLGILYLKSIKLPIASTEYKQCMQEIGKITTRNTLGRDSAGYLVQKGNTAEINYSINKSRI